MRDQFIAKLQRKKQHLSEAAARDFETRAGMAPDEFIAELRTMALDEIAAWFTQNPDLGEILDRVGEGQRRRLFISDHADKLSASSAGYGAGSKPKDYLKEFAAFINSQPRHDPALTAVLTRPRELTRKQLRELALELDKAGFSETTWPRPGARLTNQEIAARIVGYIRQAALGRSADALRPAGRQRPAEDSRRTSAWSTPQRQWLQRIAAQTKANLIVDREALDDPDQIFKREGGGFERLNRIFDGDLQAVLDRFNEALWLPRAA